MAKRAFTVGSYVHVIKRGTRGLPIVKDVDDRWRFLRSLYYLNNTKSYDKWPRTVNNAGAKGGFMPWPSQWQDRGPLVNIHAYVLMNNHFHLLLEEITEGGIAKFMQKTGESMTKSFNEKYDTQGSLFQGSYRSSVIESDDHLKFLLAYILVKNPFELFPSGFDAAVNNFDEAFNWAMDYPFCSLANSLGKRESTLILTDNFSTLFKNTNDFKVVAKEALTYMHEKKINDLALEY